MVLFIEILHTISTEFLIIKKISITLPSVLSH